MLKPSPAPTLRPQAAATCGTHIFTHLSPSFLHILFLSSFLILFPILIQFLIEFFILFHPNPIIFNFFKLGQKSSLPKLPPSSPLLNFQTFGQFPQSGPPANSSDGLCPLLQHNYNPGAHLRITFRLQRFLLYFFLSCCEWCHIFSNFGDVVMDRRHSARLIPL